MSCKIAIIGAGGACFGIGFAKKICDSEYLKGSTIVMMDIDEGKLADATNTALRYRDKTGSDVKIVSTTDREEALNGADYVIWFITTSNPVQAGITYLGRKYPGAKIVGMCPGFNCFNWHIEQMGLDPKRAEYDFAGVNHFIWLTEFKYDGKDAMPLLYDYMKRDAEKVGGIRKQFDVCLNYGLYPIGDTAETGGGAWGWYYHVDKETEDKYFDDPTHVWNYYFNQCEKQQEYKRKISTGELPEDAPDPVPMMPDWTIDLIESMEADLGEILSVNVMNDKKYMKGLPRDYQTEIKAVVDAKGIHPIPNNGLPRQIMSVLMRDRMAPVEMELVAFETGDKRYLKELIMMDPWTKNEQQADAFLDEILNQPWNKEMKDYFR